MKISELILQAARTAVKEAQRQKLGKDTQLNTFKKTERALYEYPQWTQDENETTAKFCGLIGRALKQIENDPYYDIIELKYFKRWTHERIAEYFDVDVSVISKQRTKLINRIRPIIFSEEFIKELIES